jgi:hypothetical protein
MFTPDSDCTDKVVGNILASWRYDISGISPEMSRDYTQHLGSCDRCRQAQQFHRNVDVALTAVSVLAVLGSPLALALIWHAKPMDHVTFRVLGLGVSSMYEILVSAAVAGICLSVLALALVLTATPAPAYLGYIAAERVKILEMRLPEAIKALRPR